MLSPRSRLQASRLRLILTHRNPLLFHSGSTQFCTKIGISSHTQNTKAREVSSSRDVDGHSHPMKVLTEVFQGNKRAALQHRELIESLAAGDAKSAAEVASLLAATVKATYKNRKCEAREDESGRHPESLPPLPLSTLSEATDKVQETLSESSTSSSVTEEDQKRWDTPWNSPEALRIIVIESLFETFDEESEKDIYSQFNALHEKPTSEYVLQRYLTEEEEKWKEQKRLVAEALLKAVKFVHLLPLDLQACESSVSARKRNGLNPVQHANLVVRGEVPGQLDYRDEKTSVRVESKCQRELELLKKGMIQLGRQLSAVDEELALYEIRRANTLMRYSIGVHHDLESALDTSPSVLKQLRSTPYGQMKGSQYFTSSVIKLLNPCDEDAEYGAIPSLNREEQKIIQTPVIPFTFMLKCCLWFEIPA